MYLISLWAKWITDLYAEGRPYWIPICDELFSGLLCLHFSAIVGNCFDVGKLWTAPEILRENFPPPRGTQKGDVFSFAIVSYEIMMRTEPYCFDHMTARGQYALKYSFKLKSSFCGNKPFGY